MPTTAESVPPPATSIADVLQAIASADGKTWFPAEYATETDCPRADLNAPLNELRLAGYVEVIDWVRGRGQGYGLTAAGRKALNLPGPIVLDQPKPRATEANPSRLTPLERGDIARTALFAPRTALVTPVLVTLIVLWFLAGLGLAIRDGGGASAYLRGASPAVLMKLGAVSGSNLLRGEWWRLGSCVFVHIGLLHIAVNLFALLSIGPVAEGLWGRWRFALVFFGSGFAGACVAMAVRPDSALAGASGAVWGILASVVAWLALYANHFPPDLIADLSRRLAVAVAVNALISFAPGVSWEAHLGGGVTGFCVALLTHLLRPSNGWKSLAAAAVLLFLPLVFAVAMKRTIEYSATWAPLRYHEDLRQQRERMQILPDSTHYPQVAVLYAKATYANLRGSPEQIAAIRTRVGQMKAGADAARGTVQGLTVTSGDADFRRQTLEYLDALIQFAADMLEMTTPDRKPDPIRAAAWGNQKKLVEAKWKALIGS